MCFYTVLQPEDNPRAPKSVVLRNTKNSVVLTVLVYVSITNLVRCETVTAMSDPTTLSLTGSNWYGIPQFFQFAKKWLKCISTAKCSLPIHPRPLFQTLTESDVTKIYIWNFKIMMVTRQVFWSRRLWSTCLIRVSTVVDMNCIAINVWTICKSTMVPTASSNCASFVS